MPTYQLITMYKVWYSLEVVAASEEDAEELFETLNPRKDGEAIEYSYEHSYIERVD